MRSPHLRRPRRAGRAIAVESSCCSTSTRNLGTHLLLAMDMLLFYTAFRSERKPGLFSFLKDRAFSPAMVKAKAQRSEASSPTFGTRSRFAVFGLMVGSHWSSRGAMV